VDEGGPTSVVRQPRPALNVDVLLSVDIRRRSADSSIHLAVATSSHSPGGGGGGGGNPGGESAANPTSSSGSA